MLASLACAPRRFACRYWAGRVALRENRAPTHRLTAPAREGRMTVTIGRWELLAALGGAAAAWPLAVRAQQPFAPTTETTLRDVQSAARAMGLQIQVLNASTSRKIDAAFAIKPVIPNRCNRKQPFSFSKCVYKLRWRI